MRKKYEIECCIYVNIMIKSKNRLDIYRNLYREVERFGYAFFNVDNVEYSIEKKKEDDERYLEDYFYILAPCNKDGELSMTAHNKVEKEAEKINKYMQKFCTDEVYIHIFKADSYGDIFLKNE